MYYLLTDSFKSQEQKLVEMITAKLVVEKIFMLGSSLRYKRTESVFLTTAPSCRSVGHYYLLVLIDKDCGISNNNMQDRIENICSSFIPVTAIVLNLQQFTNWLNEGHRFVSTVVNIAVVIYDANKIIFTKPVNDLCHLKLDGKLHINEANTVNEFIAGAQLYLHRNQTNMAMFMLHQAKEQALHCIFKKATGLHINTHNLDKLIRYCSLVSYKVEELFLRNNDKSKKLFMELQNSYINSRYRKHCSLSKVDVALILAKVKTLQKELLDLTT
jgi:HEPN domain-containing protein